VVYSNYEETDSSDSIAASEASIKLILAELSRVEVWLLSWWGGSSRRAAHYAGHLGIVPLGTHNQNMIA
jgi:hypothetical protein